MTINTQEKLKNYTNIWAAINDYISSFNGDFKTKVNIYIPKVKYNINYENMLQTDIYKLAKSAFNKIGKNFFINNGEIIYVSNSDIKESIAKTVRYLEQKKMIHIHLIAFEHLDKIIKNSVKINLAPETKKRSEYLKWFYYATLIKINKDLYIVQFDTVLRNNNEKHFRLQRIYYLKDILKKRDISTGKTYSQ